MSRKKARSSVYHEKLAICSLKIRNLVVTTEYVTTFYENYTITCTVYTMKTNFYETFDRRVSNFDCMLLITANDTCFLNALSNDG